MNRLSASRRWPSWINMLAGIWLFVSPWVFNYTDRSGFFWSSLITGAAIFLFGLWSAVTGHVAPSYLNVLAGAWAIVQPFVFTSGTVGGAFKGTLMNAHWNSLIVGVVVVVMALIALAYKYAWLNRRGRPEFYERSEGDCRELGTC